MIYIRKVELTWSNIQFELIQDDMLGNYILSRNPSDFADLEKLAIHVINSIKKTISENTEMNFKFLDFM